eukprot:TRINITY_DN4723_c0_g1_i1.p1 TRINITY_DN4723_c0_g1~~TRINITY_DN4723_c0_g1_i1.p1  ORF type:complete len:345 (+),score=53.77 TRINITY_DN4723_c0_g1_i1:55-1089(+)
MKPLLLLIFAVSFASTLIIPPTNPNIRYSGRIDSTYTFEWSGIEIAATFTGTSLAVILEDHWNNHNEYNVFIDGQLKQIIAVASPGIVTYRVAIGLPKGSHNVLITKRTEAFFGPATFHGFEIDDGESLTPTPPPPSRRIEIIGDSITCGYGDEGKFPCSFSPPTENNFLSYGPVIARALNAEYHLEAWSGMGMVRNYGDKNITSETPFPALFPYILPTDRTTNWQYSKWVPQVVIINLGTNDYSTEPYPPEDIFVRGYLNFINLLRSVYNPVPKFFLVCGPMEGNPSCGYVKNAALQSRETYVDLMGILQFPEDYGCDYHPSVGGHQKMANKTLPIIKSVMGW